MRWPRSPTPGGRSKSTPTSFRGFLNFVYNGNFNESPNHNGLFRFDAANSIQTFGLQFDAPINRRAERNQYRADQIQYQRAPPCLHADPRHGRAADPSRHA